MGIGDRGYQELRTSLENRQDTEAKPIEHLPEDFPGKLAGVAGKPEVVGDGVPAVKVKPDGNVTAILATLVGVVLSLNVTSILLLVAALIPNRPKATLV